MGAYWVCDVSRNGKGATKHSSLLGLIMRTQVNSRSRDDMTMNVERAHSQWGWSMVSVNMFSSPTIKKRTRMKIVKSFEEASGYSKHVTFQAQPSRRNHTLSPLHLTQSVISCISSIINYLQCNLDISLQPVLNLHRHQPPPPIEGSPSQYRNPCINNIGL
jgi:hypothetical protein